MRNQPIDDDRPCAKCGSHHTRVIGQSVSPPVFYVTCADCGHSSGVSSASESDAPDAQRVEWIIRSILTDFDLPADVTSVAKTTEGWQVVLRTRSHRIVRLQVLDAEPGSIRSAVTRALAQA